MKNLIITIVGIGVVGGLAVVGYKMINNPDSGNLENSEKDASSEISVDKNTEDNNDNEDGNYFETVQDLMARGKSMKCTYTFDVEEGDGETSTGVIYMADKNARTEITVKNADGSTGKMYAIVDQEWTHNWIDGASEGIKMKLEASEMDEENEETVSDMTNEVEFECKSWKKDNSKFEIPTNVVFQDLSEMAAGFKDVDLAKENENAEAQANIMVCELCQNVPAELRAECLDGVVCDWSE